jgi:iron complex outermembrane recepter protein
MQTRKHLFLSSATALFTIAATPALAQTTSPASQSPAGPDTQLTEIVVTAEHVQASAQKTPISMVVLDPETLSRAGVYNFQTLTAVAPGLSFSENVGAPFLALRGVTSTNVSETGDPAVVMSTDGFYLNRYYQLLDGFYDVQRVEVLKGPQGTLVGRNAVGGAVNIIDNQPQDTFSGYASLEYGNYNTLNVEGMANIPITNDFAMRMSFLSQYHEGYVDQTLAQTPGLTQKGDDQDSQSGRVQFAWHPGDHFKANVTLQYTHDGGVGAVLNEIPWAYTTSAGTPCAAASATCFLVQSAQPYGNGHSFTVGAPSGQDITGKEVRWNFSYDGLPWGVTATYLGGYDSTNYEKITALTPLAGPFSPAQYYQLEYPKTQNQELRFSSANTGPLTWQAGFFYFEENNHLNSTAIKTRTDSPSINFYEPSIVTKSTAGYAQASYQMIDALKLTGGLRYTTDNKSEPDGTFSVYPAAVGLSLPYPLNQDPLVSETYAGNSSSSKTTYHAGIDWTPTSQSLIYAKYDTGYKAGGFNQLATHGAAAWIPYAPETISGFEIGTKNNFLDHRFELNLSAFDYHYENLQVTQFISNGLSSTSATENAKSASDKGFEVQVVALLNPIGRFDVEVDYLDAKFTNFLQSTISPLNPAVFPNCSANLAAQNCQLAGNTLAFSPRFIVALGFEHSWYEVLDGTVTFAVRSHLQTKEYFDAFNLPDTTMGGYTKTDLNLIYESAKGGWKVDAYVRNIENSTILTDSQPVATGGLNSNVYGFAPPRTFGVKISKSF